MLQIVGVSLAEGGELLTVDVQHGHDRFLPEERNDDLGTRPRTAGNVTGKLLYIGHDHGLAGCPSGSTHTFPLPDACASDRTLKGTQHQLPADHAIETDPKKAEGFPQGGRHVGHIGHFICLTRYQRLYLRIPCF